MAGANPPSKLYTLLRLCLDISHQSGDSNCRITERFGDSASNDYNALHQVALLFTGVNHKLLFLKRIHPRVIRRLYGIRRGGIRLEQG